MRKKVLIMRKTRWIMRKIFGSLRSPKLTFCHAAKIELSPKPRVCSQANFKKKNYMKLSYVMFNENNTTVILLAEVDFLLMQKQYNSRCYMIYYNTAR